MGVSPGRDTRCTESGCFPGRDWSSAEDGCSPDEGNYCVLDDYCINSAYVLIRRRHSPWL